MIAWINGLVMAFSVFLCSYFYVKSADPARLEEKIGEKAYTKCTQFRIIASAFMVVVAVTYVVFFFYPLPLPLLPRTFSWGWSTSVVIALLIAVLGGYLWVRGIIDAGEETLVVKKEHTLYKGIYEKLRHPQAVGEVTFWWVIAFVLNSPFLALFSLVWIPIFYGTCLAEEKDLIIRYGEEYAKYRESTGFVIPQRKQ